MQFLVPDTVPLPLWTQSDMTGTCESKTSSEDSVDVNAAERNSDKDPAINIRGGSWLGEEPSPRGRPLESDENEAAFVRNTPATEVSQIWSHIRALLKPSDGIFFQLLSTHGRHFDGLSFGGGRSRSTSAAPSVRSSSVSSFRRYDSSGRSGTNKRYWTHHTGQLAPDVVNRPIDQSVWFSLHTLFRECFQVRSCPLWQDTSLVCRFIRIYYADFLRNYLGAENFSSQRIFLCRLYLETLLALVARPFQV